MNFIIADMGDGEMLVRTNISIFKTSRRHDTTASNSDKSKRQLRDVARPKATTESCRQQQGKNTVVLVASQRTCCWTSDTCDSDKFCCSSHIFCCLATSCTTRLALATCQMLLVTTTMLLATSYISVATFILVQRQLFFCSNIFYALATRGANQYEIFIYIKFF